MRFKFDETMTGSLRPADSAPGSEHYFSFTVRAEAPGVIAYAAGRPLVMTGTVDLSGHATRKEMLNGQLYLGLPFRRELIYSFAFTGDDGAYYRFHGQKQVYLLRFPSTMSTLRGEVHRNGELLGSSVLYFNWADLPSFAWSFGLA